MNEVTMDKIVSLCKRRGFVYPGSEIYGGLANTWDYGPIGVELKNNIQKIWWKNFIQKRPDMVGVDAAILMNAAVWKASGHVDGFSDPLMDCKNCKNRVRADKLIEEFSDDRPENWSGEKTPPADVIKFVKDKNISCPQCQKCDWTDPKQFNLMFETRQGVTKDSGSIVYLRPETAQGIFVNFKNIQQTTRKKLPFGIGQAGKAFRNEITPGNFTFRTREFEQMEIEYFCHENDWKPLYDGWREEMEKFYLEILQFGKEKMRWRKHADDELSHYSKETWDVEFKFPFGWGELWGIAYRTNFDLSQHEKFSGQNLKYRDPLSNEEYMPHCIEPTFGLTRTTLVALINAYNKEQLADGTERIVMKFAPKIAPIKLAILPLMKKDGLAEKSDLLLQSMSEYWNCDYDAAGAIGRRYRRQDEIGTPFCITVDYDTLKDDTVTIRDRDSMEQIRMPIANLKSYFQEKF